MRKIGPVWVRGHQENAVKWHWSLSLQVSHSPSQLMQLKKLVQAIDKWKVSNGIFPSKNNQGQPRATNHEIRLSQGQEWRVGHQNRQRDHWKGSRRTSQVLIGYHCHFHPSMHVKLLTIDQAKSNTSTARSLRFQQASRSFWHPSAATGLWEYVSKLTETSVVILSRYCHTRYLRKADLRAIH